MAISAGEPVTKEIALCITEKVLPQRPSWVMSVAADRDGSALHVRTSPKRDVNSSGDSSRTTARPVFMRSQTIVTGARRR